MSSLNPPLHKDPVFTWSPTEYQAYLKSPAGQAEQTKLQVVLLEQFYGAAKAREINEKIAKQEIAPQENNRREGQTRREAAGEMLSLQERERLLGGGAREIARKSTALAESEKEADKLLQDMSDAAKQLSAKLEELEEEHKQYEFSVTSDYSQENYNKAQDSFAASYHQLAKMQKAIQCLDAAASVLEKKANHLERAIREDKKELDKLAETYGKTSPVYQEKVKQIQRAEHKVMELRKEALGIRVKINALQKKVDNLLGKTQRDESAMEMGYQQSLAKASEPKRQQKASLNLAIQGLNAEDFLKKTVKNKRNEQQKELNNEPAVPSSSSRGGA